MLREYQTSLRWLCPWQDVPLVRAAIQEQEEKTKNKRIIARSKSPFIYLLEMNRVPDAPDEPKNREARAPAPAKRAGMGPWAVCGLWLSGWPRLRFTMAISSTARLLDGPFRKRRCASEDHAMRCDFNCAHAVW